MTQGKPRVLVLMAARNGAEWIEAQIQSILDQAGVAVHLLIGDDLSTDNTREMIKSFSEVHRRVELIAWSDASGSAGANFRRLFKAASASGFDYIALADQDDIWLPQKLVAAIDALQNSKAQGYSCAVEAFWPDGRASVVCQSAATGSADFLFEGAGQGCTFVVPASLFIRVREFSMKYPQQVDQLHYHDWLIYLLVRAWGGTWYFDPIPWVRYRQHGTNEIGARGGWQSIEGRIRKIQSGWYKGQITAAIQVLRCTGASHPSAERFAKIFLEDDSVGRRIRLLGLAFVSSRRRIVDRIVVVGSALFGWI